jgi:hypothetical protein
MKTIYHSKYPKTKTEMKLKSPIISSLGNFPARLTGGALHVLMGAPLTP